MLAEQPHRTLVAEMTPQAATIELALPMTGLDPVDVYVDGRPRTTVDVQDGQREVSVEVNGARGHLDLRGIFTGELAVCQRLQLGG